MVSRSRLLIERELARLGPAERRAADALALTFPETFGAGGYDLDKLAREGAYPMDLDQQDLLAYVQTAFAVTCLRDRFCCVFCGLDGLESPENYAAIQVDHLVPVRPEDPSVWDGVGDSDRFVRGYAPDNLACACRSCNSSKSNRVLGVTLAMGREARIDAASARFDRTSSPGKPHESPAKRYTTEVHQVRAFVAAYLAATRAT